MRRFAKEPEEKVQLGSVCTRKDNIKTGIKEMCGVWSGLS
jgi:hypothetical protein